jgi:hypothetical protein
LDAGVNADELGSEVGPVKPGLGDEELGGGFGAVQALGVSAQGCGEGIG